MCSMDISDVHCFPGPYIINLRRTWEKLLLAARAIAAIEHPAEVFVISSRPHGQRAVLKFAAHTGATAIAGRFTPGAFTNQIQVGIPNHLFLGLIFQKNYLELLLIALLWLLGCLPWTQAVGCHWPCHWQAAHHWGLLCQHSCYCFLQYWFPPEICGYCHSLQY